jgi:membrane carboxypeptidase/penicillin-binding protein
VIAGIIQAPGRLSPFVNPKAALMRRNYVLQRMAEEGFISDEESREAQERPLVLQGQPRPEPSVAPYFAEEIRKTLEQQYGADALYQNGLQVQTTLDAELQEAANRAVDRGLRALDKRHSGFRKVRQCRRRKAFARDVHHGSLESAHSGRRYRAGSGDGGVSEKGRKRQRQAAYRHARSRPAKKRVHVDAEDSGR